MACQGQGASRVMVAGLDRLAQASRRSRSRAGTQAGRWQAQADRGRAGILRQSAVLITLLNAFRVAQAATATVLASRSRSPGTPASSPATAILPRSAR